MKALPEAMRQIVRDLVEKRLWPVAVLLLAVAVALPMLIGRAAPDAAAPVPVAATAPAAPAAALPATAGEDVGAKKRGGRINDPFYDPPAAPTAPAATAAAASSASADTATNAAPSPAETAAPSAGTSAASTAPEAAATATPAVSATAAPAPSETPRSSVYHRAVVRWGTSTLAEPHAIARLTPLGGRRDLAALYLGMTRSDATYAIFVLGPNASSRGDATCRRGTDCRMIGLKVGDVQRFTVRDPDGGVPRRFTLRVDVLRAVRTSATAAASARAKVHRAGRSVLREMWRLPTEAAVLRRASYDQRSGLLRAAREPDDVEQAAK